jgi:5-methylcytosine-specific restriction endonuclease McrA
MLKVVRRDGQICRACHKNVPDNEIEFDHVIPNARGGPTTPENLRILCRGCNRQKSEALKEILADDALRE